jgi:multidrug efflux system outer membrane protein
MPVSSARINCVLRAMRAEATVGTGRTPPDSASDAVRVDAFASWEIDLFGRLRRLTEASRADLLASEEGRRFAVLTLVSTVASTYINLLAVDAQLDIARRTLVSRAEALRIFEARYKRGATSEFEFRSRVRNMRSQVDDPAARTDAGADRKCAGIVARAAPLPATRRWRRRIARCSTGLPSEILERRPDVKQAELNLIAANAASAAKALYYPSISLTGLYGSVSDFIQHVVQGCHRAVQLWRCGRRTHLHRRRRFRAGQRRASAPAAALLAYQRAIRALSTMSRMR